VTIPYGIAKKIVKTCEIESDVLNVPFQLSWDTHLRENPQHNGQLEGDPPGAIGSILEGPLVSARGLLLG